MSRITITGALLLSICLSAPAQTNQTPRDDRGKPKPVTPQFVDPGFESFKLVRAPINGWFSDDVMETGSTRYGLLTMKQDETTKVEGRYSLRIDQLRPRQKGFGQAYLAQAVRLPARGGATRRFELSAQMRGSLIGPVLIEVYVWDPPEMAHAIARLNFTVRSEWSPAVLTFKVPEGRDSFGVWFYLPRDDEARLWIDDVRLSPLDAK